MTYDRDRYCPKCGKSRATIVQTRDAGLWLDYGQRMLIVRWKDKAVALDIRDLESATEQSVFKLVGVPQ